MPCAEIKPIEPDIVCTIEGNLLTLKIKVGCIHDAVQSKNDFLKLSAVVEGFLFFKLFLEDL